MQDIYKATPSTQREVAGVLANAWWVNQLTGTVVTAQIGADSRQFVKLVDGSWITPGAGPVATLTVSGSRTISNPDCTGFPPPTIRPAAGTTRAWASP